MTSYQEPNEDIDMTAEDTIGLMAAFGCPREVIEMHVRAAALEAPTRGLVEREWTLTGRPVWMEAFLRGSEMVYRVQIGDAEDADSQNPGKPT